MLTAQQYLAIAQDMTQDIEERHAALQLLADIAYTEDGIDLSDDELEQAAREHAERVARVGERMQLAADVVGLLG